MKYVMSITAAGALLLAMGCETPQQWNGQTFALGEPQSSASQPAIYPNQASNNPFNGSTNASPELDLVNILVGQLGINSQQAVGGVGSIFALAQQRMNPGDFIQLSGSLPGMDRYLSAVPQPAKSNSWLSSAAGLMGGEHNGLGSLAALAGSFQALGLNTNMISQFVPVVLEYVQDQSGPAAMSLLQNALY